MAERKCGSAPSDLVNQLRHLKERLEQQKTLIDDLEYQYLEVSTICQRGLKHTSKVVVFWE